MNSFSTRRRSREWMDEPGIDPAELQRSLRFIQRVNRRLGYARSMITHLDRFSRDWKPGERISVIDFATGSADIPRAMLRWADRRGFDLRITAVDLHETTIRIAARQTDDARLRFVRGDVLRLPFDDGTFDYATCAMFLHHLSDDDAAAVLAGMSRLARRGIIAADLLRRRGAYFWISLFTLLSTPMVRHDARVSVAQAFDKAEVFALRDRARIPYARYFRHFGYRWALAGEKPSVREATHTPAFADQTVDAQMT